MLGHLDVARVGLVALLALTVACGGSGDDDTASAGDTGSATVTVEHRYGSTEVPVEPERIVSLDLQWTDVLLALDAPPVGYLVDANAAGGFPWQGDELAGATTISATDALPYEQIAALDPDVIVVTYLAADEADYERLAEIAPTIPLLSASDQVDPWQDIAEVAGDVLDVKPQAGALIADVDAAITAVADGLLGLEGGTYAMVNYVPGDAIYVVADPDDGANVLFAQLGMAITPTILDAADDVEGRVELSLEQTALLDADVLVLFTNDADPADIPGYEQLPAVRGGAVAVLDYAGVVGLNTPTPLSVPYSLELIRPALEAAAA
jgi:iron complex transport system substrate-binding protein